MLQRLPIALAQVKADNTSGNKINEIKKPCILCTEQKKVYSKKVYRNIITKKVIAVLLKKYTAI